MALSLNCLESLAAIGCGLAAVSINGAEASALSGVTIAGVSLLAKMRENIRRHGLDEQTLLEKMRMGVLREWGDRLDSTPEERDLLVEADQAMARLLPQVMLTREELGETAISASDGRFPAHAARLVADRLASHDPIFAAFDGPDDVQPLARRFALQTIKAALNIARSDKDYAILLTLDVLLSVGRATAQLIEQGQLVRGGLSRVERLVDEGLAHHAAHAQQFRDVKAMIAQMMGDRVSVEQIQREFAQIIAFEPGATAHDVLRKVQQRVVERDQQIAELRTVASIHLDVERERECAAQAFADQDDSAGAAHLQSATQLLRQRRDDDSRLIYKLASTRAVALARRHNWLGANEAWSEASDAIATLDRALFLEAQLTAAVYLMSAGQALGSIEALDAAIARFRTVLDGQSQGEVVEEWHALRTNLGISLDLRARLSDSDIAADFLAEAIAAHEAALTSASDKAARGAILCNLSTVLCLKAQLCPGDNEHMLLARSLETAHAAVVHFDREADPTGWSSANSACAGVCVVVGLGLPMGQKLEMLRLAAHLYIESLPVIADTSVFKLGLVMEDIAVCYEAMAASGEDDRGNEYLQLARQAAMNAQRAFEDVRAVAKQATAAAKQDHIERRMIAMGYAFA